MSEKMTPERVKDCAHRAMLYLFEEDRPPDDVMRTLAIVGMMWAEEHELLNPQRTLPQDPLARLGPPLPPVKRPYPIRYLP